MTISNPREVDERDTLWERSDLDLRVFINDAAGVRRAFDLDRVSLAEAELWARSQAGATSSVSIAVRSFDAHGRTGLIWLTAEPTN